MIQEHGNISLFSMQGLEKLNDLTTMSYFSSSNKHSDYLVQLIKKRNRMELMQNWSETKFLSSHEYESDNEDFYLELESDDESL
jgi:hypothetical protein